MRMSLSLAEGSTSQIASASVLATTVRWLPERPLVSFISSPTMASWASSSRPLYSLQVMLVASGIGGPGSVVCATVPVTVCVQPVSNPAHSSAATVRVLAWVPIWATIGHRPRNVNAMRSDLPQGPDSPPTDELRSAELSLGVLHQVVRSIAEDDLVRQTPCSEFDVAGLTEHLVRSITILGGAAGAEMPERDPLDSVERQVILAARPALDAWHRRGIDGAVDVGGTTMPATVLVGILSLEFLVHAWDYATAIGHTVPAPDSLSDYVLAMAEKIVTPQGRARAGFDDPVEVPDDAPPLQRLLAFTGRRAEV